MKCFIRVVVLFFIVQINSYAAKVLPEKLWETVLPISCTGNTIGGPNFVDANFFDEWFLHLEGRKGSLGIIKDNMIFHDNSNEYLGRPNPFKPGNKKFLKI